MADPDTSRLRALLEKATALPWCADSVGEKENRVIIGVAFAPDDDGCENPLSGWVPELGEDSDDIYCDEKVCELDGSNVHADAALIVESVNALPALLTAAERAKGLEEENATLREIVRRAQEQEKAADILRDVRETFRFSRGDKANAHAEYVEIHRSACRATESAVRAWREKHGGIRAPAGETKTAQHFAASQHHQEITNEHEHGRHLRDERRTGRGTETAERGLQDSDATGHEAHDGTDRREDRVPGTDAAGIVGCPRTPQAWRRDQEDARRTQEHGSGSALASDRHDALPRGTDGRRPGGNTTGVLLNNQAEGAAIREDAGTVPRANAPSASPALAWTEEQREAARNVVAEVWFCCTELDPHDDDSDLLACDMERYGDRFCAEIAKHAHLFVKPRVVTREEFEKARAAFWFAEGDVFRAFLRALGMEVE